MRRRGVVHETLFDAFAIALVSAVVGLVFNAARAKGIPFIQKTEYQILVPCPEPVGEAEAIKPTDARIGNPAYVVVDARSREEYDREHHPAARSLPFDFLEPTSDEAVKGILKGRIKGVLVYGDGLNPDSGRELARELAGKGLKNVFYIEGGAPEMLVSRPGKGGP